MPPVQHAETLAALGVCAGVVVFLAMLALLGVAILIEEMALRGKKHLRLRQPQEEK